MSNECSIRLVPLWFWHTNMASKSPKVQYLSSMRRIICWKRQKSWHDYYIFCLHFNMIECIHMPSGIQHSLPKFLDFDSKHMREMSSRLEQIDASHSKQVPRNRFRCIEYFVSFYWFSGSTLSYAFRKVFERIEDVGQDTIDGRFAAGCIGRPTLCVNHWHLTQDTNI